MEIRQGDAYTLAVTLTDENGTPLTDEDVSVVEISIGGLTKSTKTAGVTYLDGTFQMPIYQTDSHNMSGILPTQVRVLFPTGEVASATLGFMHVTASVSKSVLANPAQEK